MEVMQVKDECDIFLFLERKGFSTNYCKRKNANGEDIVAVKNGNSYKIEIKKVVENKTTGAFKLQSNNIKGDILILIFPNGLFSVSLHPKTSLTKTTRFVLDL